MTPMDMRNWSSWPGEDIERITLMGGNIEIKFKDESVIMALAVRGFTAPKEQPIHKLTITNMTGEEEDCEITPRQ